MTTTEYISYALDIIFPAIAFWLGARWQRKKTAYWRERYERWIVRTTQMPGKY